MKLSDVPDWEYNRHHRTDSGNSSDMFDKVLDKMIVNMVESGDLIVEDIDNIMKDGYPPVSAKRIKYRLPEPPKPGPAMKPEDAFAQLRNSGVIK